MYGSNFLFLIYLIQTAFTSLPIRIEKFKCTGNDVYLSNLVCSMGIVREKMQVLNFDCTFNEDMNDLTKEGGNYRIFNIDSKEDLCKVLDKTERSNVVSRMMPMWKYYGHFPEICPIKGDVSVRRYPLDLSFYPSIFPSGDFQIVVQIIETITNVGILNVTANYSIKY